MFMEKIRICKTCQIEFRCTSAVQVFCNRKCFKKDYCIRVKRKQALLEKYPMIMCRYCCHEERLTFDPLKFAYKYQQWRCPECSIQVHQVLQFQDRHHSNLSSEDAPFNLITTLYPVFEDSPLEFGGFLSEKETKKMLSNYLDDSLDDLADLL
jgi:hypothetical protein